MVTAEFMVAWVLSMTMVALAAEPADQPDKPLVGTTWAFTEIDGEPVIAEGRDGGPYIELQREESRYAGSGGVNRFGGGYKLDGASLKFAEAFSTMMAGPDHLMQQEQKILQSLPKVDSFVIAGNVLTLKAGDKVLFTLRAK